MAMLENSKTSDLISSGLGSKVLEVLEHFKSKDEGFTGLPFGPGHIASTYAAFLSILIVGTEEAYKSLDKEGLKRFFLSLRNKDAKGSYLMHQNGEADLRAIYIVVLISATLGILDSEITDGVVEYIQSCQTYEGGLGPSPYSEAHGGYTFCGVAALCLLGRLHDSIDLQRLLQWLTARQMTLEGGFSGRTNKLVDSCYSFWQGGTFFAIYWSIGKKLMLMNELLDKDALIRYVLCCCQNEKGGLKDKPGKKADFYHTNYSLLGLSCVVNSDFHVDEKLKLEHLEEVHPLFGIPKENVQKALLYFKTIIPRDNA